MSQTGDSNEYDDLHKTPPTGKIWRIWQDRKDMGARLWHCTPTVPALMKLRQEDQWCDNMLKIEGRQGRENLGVADSVINQFPE